MTDEEMKQTMGFILEQQVQFAVNVDVLRENIDVLRENVNSLAESQKRTEETVATLVRMQTHMNEVVAVMAEAQERTDDRLNTLINVVERHIREGHNGKAKG